MRIYLIVNIKMEYELLWISEAITQLFDIMIIL